MKTYKNTNELNNSSLKPNFRHLSNIGPILAVFFGLLLIFSILAGNAGSSLFGDSVNDKAYYSAQAESAPFYIFNLNKTIKINENKTLDITDEMDIYFTNESNVFVYKMPSNFANEMELNGKKYKFRYTANLSVDKTEIEGGDASFKVVYNNESSEYMIQIFDRSDKLHNKEKIKLCYTYDFSLDRGGKFDALSLNLTNRRFMPQNFNARIDFPKSFDKDKILYKGNDESDNWSLDGNSVSYSYNDPNFERKTALVMQVMFDGKYFELDSIFGKIPVYYYIVFALILICIGITVASYINHIRKEKKFKLKMPFPNEDDSLSLAVAYNGSISDAHFAGKILQWAQEGFIRIENKSKIIKLKELPVTDEAYPFFQGLTDKESGNLPQAVLTCKDHYNKKGDVSGISIFKLIMLAMGILPSLLVMIVISIMSKAIIILPFFFAVFILTGYFASFIIWDGSKTVTKTTRNGKEKKVAKGSMFPSIALFVMFYCIVYCVSVFGLGNIITIQDVFYLKFVAIIWAAMCRIFIMPKIFRKNDYRKGEAEAAMFYNFVSTLDTDSAYAAKSLSRTYFFDILPYIVHNNALFNTVYDLVKPTETPEWANSINNLTSITFWAYSIQKKWD